MTPTPTSTVRLQPGETLHLPLEGQTTLQVSAGSVRLCEPVRWLAETMVTPEVALAAGASHRVVPAGWVRLQAGAGGAQLRVARAVTPWQRLWQRWRPRAAPAGREPA